MKHLFGSQNYLSRPSKDEKGSVSNVSVPEAAKAFLVCVCVYVCNSKSSRYNLG